MHRSLYDAFCQTASEQADKVAWIVPDVHSTRTIRWSELKQNVDRLALWLAKNGLQASDRVVNLEPNSEHWAMLDLACSALGAIHSPIDPRWHDQQIAWAIESLEPQAVFSCCRLGLSSRNSIPIAQALQQATVLPQGATVRQWQDSVCSNQTATILWTSGTSANPKGVMLSHGNLLTNGMAKLDAMPQSPQDVRLNLLPFAHAYARTCELTAWLLSGHAMACAPSAQRLIEIAKIVRPTLINAVPSAYDYWLQLAPSHRNHVEPSGSLRSFFGGSIRQLASGGAAIRNSIREQFAAESLPIFQGYGLTEASPVVCSNRAPREHAGRNLPAVLDGVGTPVEGVEVRIDSGQRLWVRGPGLMQGYWHDEQATELRVRNGWLDTGDTASTDVADSSSPTEQPQSIRLSGRADDLQVLCNGHKFAPLVLEQLIEQIDPVAQCVVVGADRRRPLAVLCLKPDSKIPESLLLEQIQRALANQPDHLQIAQLVVCHEPWTPENGLRHWKGGVNRKEIARRFAPQ